MKKLKKGFTLVELVIVIAVIAVLAAVLIPTFSGIIQRSKISADTQLATQLNTLAQDKTLQEFVDAVEADDKLSINSLVPQAAGHKFLWVEKQNSTSIIYVDSALKPVSDTVAEDALTDAKLWTVVTAANQVVNNAKLNYFLAVDSNQNFVLSNVVSFDTGKSTLSGNLTIQNSESNNTADINGNFAGTITINAPNATINQNGSVSTLNVTAVAQNSLHVNGFIKNLNVTKGKIELANTAYVSNLKLEASTAQVINGGVVATLDKAQDVVLSVATFDKSTGTVLAAAQNSNIDNIDAYKNNDFSISIANLAGLENFRDAVNGGATYKDVTVELTSNITLNDGWTPIGAFARAKEVKGFQGTFVGNNFTISNLNNNGYVPEESALFRNESTIANKKEYTYGLFGFVSNATITNLKLTNVNISIPSNTAAYGDSVAALVGYSYGAITLENITVGEVVQNTSRIEAYDGVGGILGRAYGDNDVTTNTDVVKVMSCQNYAIVSAGEKAGGIIGLVSNKAKLDINNVNNYGTINVNAQGLVRNQAFAGGIIAMVGSPATGSQIIGSSNNGNVTITSTLTNGTYYADGIVGQGASTVTHTNTANNATVTVPQAQA